MLLHTIIYQIKLLLDDPFHRTVPVMFILFMTEGQCLPSNAALLPHIRKTGKGHLVLLLNYFRLWENEHEIHVNMCNNNTFLN